MNPNFEKPFTFDRVVRMLVYLSIAIVSFILIKNLSGALLPFLVAWLLAYMIYPLVKMFQYKLKLKYRVLAVFMSLISIILVISLIVCALIPMVSSEVSKMMAMINDYINHSYQINSMIIPSEWQNNFKQFMLSFDLKDAFSEGNLIEIAKKISPQFWGFISSSYSFLVSIFVVFIVILYLFFILLDYETLSEGWLKLIPNKYRVFVSQLSNDLETGMNKYFRSQALIALIVGILFAIGFRIIGLPLGILLGLFIGLLSFVPYLHTIGIFPAIILAALKSVENNENFLVILAATLIVFAIVQLIEDVILIPKIMGKSMGLNPAVILLSLSIWGALLGMVGLIIALPMTTLLISYYKRFILWEKEDIKKLNEPKV
jgi:predicted PurR-regulated permease PerM